MERKWWTLIAVCVATFMLLLDVTIVNVALPKIQTGLHSSFTDLQWVIDAYSLTLAALLLTAGSFADLIGRRIVFVIGLAVFSVASLLSGVAQSPLMLNLSRGLQGVGAAMMFATSLALLANAFRGRDRGVAFGVWGSVTGAAVSIGPVIGGVLTDALSWRWIFLVNVPIGLAAIALTQLRVEESRDPTDARLDFPGFLTFSAGLGAIVYALIETSRKSWGSTVVVACLAGGAALLVLFAVIEHRRRAPMFELSLFRRPAFTGASITAFALSAAMFAMFLYLTLYLQNILGFSPLQAGLRLLSLSGAILIVSGVAGRLTTVVPVRLLMGAGLGLVGLALLLMREITVTSGWTALLPGFIVGGVGIGLINPPLASTAVAVVPARQSGMASGINTTFRQVGIATGIAALGSIFSSHVRSDVVSHLTPTLGSARAHALSTQIASGQPRAALAHAPPTARATIAHAAHASFVAGLTEILLVGAIVALVGAVLTLLLVRSRDFVAAGEPDHAPPEPRHDLATDAAALSAALTRFRDGDAAAPVDLRMLAAELLRPGAKAPTPDVEELVRRGTAADDFYRRELAPAWENLTESQRAARLDGFIELAALLDAAGPDGGMAEDLRATVHTKTLLLAFAFDETYGYLGQLARRELPR